MYLTDILIAERSGMKHETHPCQGKIEIDLLDVMYLTVFFCLKSLAH